MAGPTSLFFDGRLTRRPGAYSKVNADAFNAPQLGASGIVALVGTSVGGKPYGSIVSPNDDLQRANNSGQVRRLFRDGDLREMGVVLFNASRDPDVPGGGAQQVVFVKANPATQSTYDFNNAAGAALRLKSADYGAFTAQIKATIANASTGSGKMVTINFEADEEVFDLLGNDEKFKLKYDGGADGATAARGQVQKTAFVGSFASFAAGSSLEIISADADDTTQTITIIGISGAGAATVTTTTLNGTTAAAVAGTWNSVIGVYASALCQGAITVRLASAGATVAASTVAFQAEFDFANAGLDTGVTQATGGASLEVVSANAGDTTQTITVYGLNASNAPQSQTAALNGTTPVAIPGTWNLETAAILSAATAGNVTLRIASAGATVVVFTAGQTNKGRVALDIKMKDGLTVKADGATTKKLVLRGVNAAGDALAEVVTLNGTTLVGFSGAFARLTAIELANVEAARTATVQGFVVNASSASYPNLQKLKDLVTTNADFTWTSVAGDLSAILLSDMDYTLDTNIYTVDGKFYAQLYDMIADINAKSVYVVASRLSPGSGVPTNTTGAVFLSGGHEGDSNNPGVPTATTTDYQNAIDLLKQVFVNTIVPATSTASIHAAVVDHCAYMGGAGKMERDCVVGAAVDETVAQLKTRALNLNSRHVRILGQEVSLFDTAGAQVWQPPMFLAAIIAGMQAGAEVGEPLTNKLANVLGVRQVSSWNPVDDGEDLLAGGVAFLQLQEGRGFKVVRNVTTHLADDNLAYTEASVNQATNFAVYNLRVEMEESVGRKGFGGTINAAKGAAAGILDRLVRDGVLAAYKSPTFELTLDTLEMEVEISPVAPINFIPITVNLKPFSITA